MTLEKRKKIIVESIYKIWIAIFELPKVIRFYDRGKLINNSEFITFCENLDIKIKATAAENIWSNGLVERDNVVLGNTVK